MSLIDDNRLPAEELYGDIINLPHPESVRHKRMSRENRAAQFAPFAALTGYEDAVNETARLTGRKIEISEEKKRAIDNKIRILLGEEDCCGTIPKIIIYYLRDKYKDGGSYISCDASVKKYIQETDSLQLVDGTIIPITDIFDIR